jgi:putative transposase
MPGNRISLRLPDYDYQFGGFFFTLVTENRARLFGQIENGEFRQTPEGAIVKEEWLRTPMLRREVRLDEWIVMPDHFHAIVFIASENVGGACWRPFQKQIPDSTERIRSIQPAQHSLARIINQFKATPTRRINELRKTPGRKVWQRNYHDRIIWNAVELDKLREYIRGNPPRWSTDPSRCNGPSARCPPLRIS